MGFLTHLGQSSYQIGFVFLSLFFVPFSNEAFPSIFSRFFFFSISFPGHRAQKKKCRGKSRHSSQETVGEKVSPTSIKNKNSRLITFTKKKRKCE